MAGENGSKLLRSCIYHLFATLLLDGHPAPPPARPPARQPWSPGASASTRPFQNRPKMDLHEVRAPVPVRLAPETSITTAVVSGRERPCIGLLLQDISTDFGREMSGKSDNVKHVFLL